MIRFSLLALFIACGVASASAQTSSDLGGEAGAGVMEVTPQLWCHVEDPAGRRIFVSEPSPLSTKGHLGQWNAGAEFLNAINARYTLTMRGSDHACGSYVSRTAVLKAQSAIISAASRDGVKIIAVGGY